jgi:methionyl-tRNA synthetase
VSKSAGVAVNLDDAIARHGPDALRYFLLREVGFTTDGDFSWERFDERYTSDLADGLGNLASRSLAMLVKYREGRVPDAGEPTSLDQAGDQVVKAYQDAMDRLELKAGAEAAWSLVTTANQFIVQNAPWALAKSGETPKLNAVLGALARCLERLAILAHPFIPGKTAVLWASLGAPNVLETGAWNRVQHPAPQGQVVSKPENLFPKPATTQPTT